ncbi:MAG: tRNA (guanosine(18)-2'-O)-methyltransferase [Oligoflexia bacterium]|nr:MAG: tRNA (guanosine(18)-2'-O)-methyltransferase [Oligoflexia bacterium]
MFPFSGEILLGQGKSVSAQRVCEKIGPLLTPERFQKIDRVIRERTFTPVVVLENIYDRGNASAVMRSAEGMGLGQVHVIELGEKFKESQRTTAGADKWVEVKKWKSTQSCVDLLKSQGKQIVVTHLDSTSKNISEVDFTKPTAIVLGNEKDGVSKEMIEAADHRVILPMVGFVQSYNISVAGALCFYHIYMDRLRRQGFHGDLTEGQKTILKAHYYMRTQDSSQDYLLELIARGEL